jgi:predicted transcriptional regulator
MTAFAESVLERTAIENVVFTLASGQKKADVSTVRAYATEALAQAIVRVVRAAVPAGGLPAMGK